MAILGKIQRSSGVAIIVIGMALFAFLIMGLLKNSSSLFQPSRDYVGKVNGVKIPTRDFQEYRANLQKRYGPGYSSSLIMRQAWDYFINQKLLEDEFKKTGISVSDDRVFDVLKNDPNIRRYFTTPQGVFDENQLIDYLEKINESKNINPKDYEAWINSIKSIKETEGQKIFTYLVRGALNPTIKEGEWAYRKETDKVSFDFVTVPYSKIPDSVVQVTEDDIKNYVAAHPDQYKAKESRNILYVKFENKPSKTDYDAVKAKLQSLIEDQVVFNEKTNKNDTIPGFRNTADADAFVKKYSDQYKPIRWFTADELPKDIADTLQKLPKGAVFGPYLRKDKFFVYKIVDRKDGVPKTADASHILISFQGAGIPGVTRSEDEARKLADSLLQVVKKNPSKFADLVKQFTDDKASVPQGGTYKDFSFGKMVEPFSEFVFTHKKGDIGIAKTRFGYHIIRVDKLSNDKTTLIKLAELNKDVEPSESTIDSIYAQVALFTQQAIKDGDLNKTAKDKGKAVMPVKKIFRYEANLPGLGEQPELVRWLYNKKTKVGDVRRFETKDGYVVVQYTGGTSEGPMPVAEASVLVKPILLKQKKFAYIKDKLKGASLDEIAKNSGGQKGHVEDVTLDAPMIPGMGKEPVVVAVAFVTPVGKISDPIRGEYGAFVVSPTKITPAPELDSYYPYVAQLKRKESNNVLNRILTALKDKAKIKDNRPNLGY